MNRGSRTRLASSARGLLAAMGLLLSGSCATPHLDDSRQTFYQGHPERAARQLEQADPDGKDEVLVLMERGMAYQVAGDYQASSDDLLRAIDRLEELETYSVSKGGATWAINDTMQNFRGQPYERTLLHTFAAMNFLALGQWESAAVEARRLNETVAPDLRGDYPDEPFSRYLAAVCFELIDDRDSAAFHYRQLQELVPDLAINPRTGQIETPPEGTEEMTHELIVFVLSGHGATGNATHSPTTAPPLYAEIQAEGTVLGRSHTLSDTWQLAALTEKEDAVRKAAKTAARIAAKEAVAQSLEHSDQDELASLARLVLIGLLERPDLRGWRTLPRWLQVARVPCPPDLEGFDLVLKTPSGIEFSRSYVDAPLRRRGRTHVSFYRHLAR